MQVATSDGANMNVGTKLDAYVYNTLAAWYNEDMKAAGSNATLPAAPSGPQPPAPASARPRFLGLAVDWSDPAFITVRRRLDSLGWCSLNKGFQGYLGLAVLERTHLHVVRRRLQSWLTTGCCFVAKLTNLTASFHTLLSPSPKPRPPQYHML